MATKKQAKVGYGMLEMLGGHQLQTAYDHIDKIDKEMGKGVDAWFFDITHTPNQKDRAAQWRDLVEQYIRDKHPDLTESNVVVMASMKRDKLPARNFMFELLYRGGAEKIDVRDDKGKSRLKK